jgi:hypothetical protein
MVTNVVTLIFLLLLLLLLLWFGWFGLVLQVLNRFISHGLLRRRLGRCSMAEELHNAGLPDPYSGSEGHAGAWKLWIECESLP